MHFCLDLRQTREAHALQSSRSSGGIMRTTFDYHRCRHRHRCAAGPSSARRRGPWRRSRDEFSDGRSAPPGTGRARLSRDHAAGRHRAAAHARQPRRIRQQSRRRRRRAHLRRAMSLTASSCPRRQRRVGDVTRWRGPAASPRARFRGWTTEQRTRDDSHERLAARAATASDDEDRLPAAGGAVIGASTARRARRLRAAGAPARGCARRAAAKCGLAQARQSGPPEPRRCASVVARHEGGRAIRLSAPHALPWAISNAVGAGIGARQALPCNAGWRSMERAATRASWFALLLAPNAMIAPARSARGRCA